MKSSGQGEFPLDFLIPALEKPFIPNTMSKAASKHLLELMKKVMRRNSMPIVRHIHLLVLRS